jgi:CheY-like chemotaxis protein
LFSRRQVMQTQRIDTNEVIVGLMKMLERLLGEHIQALFSPSVKPVWVDADVGMLEQVIVNLCVNARDAMPKGGTVTLSTEALSLMPENLPPGSEAKAGSFVCIQVQDTGCGMDETTLKRIFEPFFTTKEPGKGTGLGLATVHGIAKQHNGWVEVQSAIGRGTSFCVYLPAKDPLARTESERTNPEISGGSETILVIEDDQALRLMVKRTLTLFGYTVLEATGGDEALRLWEQHQHVDLVFADMVMPGGLTGLEVMENVRRLQPSVKVLISSGYSSNLPLELGHLPAGVRFLAKPYTPSALAAAIRQSLDEGSGVRPSPGAET